MTTSSSVVLEGGRRATIVVVPPTAEATEVARALDLPSPVGLLVLNGGTSEFPADVERRATRLLREGLARIAIEERLTAITGGTDVGVFRMFGGALDERATAPCVGVAPTGTVVWPGGSDDTSAEERAPLEPHHSHFVLVEGDEWGTETGTMVALADVLASGCPSLAVLVGGGPVARNEVLGHVRQGREVVVVAGTGRLADELAGEGGASEDEVAEIRRSGRVTVLPADAGPAALADLVRSRLV